MIRENSISRSGTVCVCKRREGCHMDKKTQENQRQNKIEGSKSKKLRLTDKGRGREADLKSEDRADPRKGRMKLYEKERNRCHQKEWDDIDAFVRYADIRHAPDGTLQVHRKGKSFQYYHAIAKSVKNENKQTEYIKSADRQLASQ